MNDLSDQQLLRDYAASRRETAFAELVRRHVDLVYSAALRMVRESHLAKDVTQGVFLALAGNAPRLAEHPVLSGWLHCTARNLAAKAIRSDARRRVREQEAAAMNELLSTQSEPSWETIAPQLDDALGELNDADREALLLRYFEKKSAPEMAGILGISHEAAQKRVTRAVERLRESLAGRGVGVATGGLAVAIAANAVQAAPAGLAAVITAATFAGTVVTTSTLIAATTKTIAMTALQKTIIGAALTAAIGTGIYQAHQAAQLREQNQGLQQQLAPLAGQIEQLQRDHDETADRLAGLLAENAQLKSGSNFTELLKLRGEIARIKAADDDPTLAAAKAMAKKVNALKQRLEQTPQWKIPELEFLTDMDWATAVWDADLSTDDGVREALSKVRETAINTFLNVMMKTAFKKYLAVSGNVLPANLYQLEPYFDQPVTDDMLQRYQLLQSGTPDNHATLVKLSVNVDDEYDSNHEMSINGAGGSRFNRVKQAVEAAINAFSGDNPGQVPTDASQLTSYLKTPIETVTVQKYLNLALADPSRLQGQVLTPALQAYADANNGQMPKNPSDLLPYASTPEQKAALQRIMQNNPAAK